MEKSIKDAFLRAHLHSYLNSPRTSRYLDDLLYIDNSYFEQMVSQIYPTELQLNKTNSSDTKAQFLDLDLVLNQSRFKAMVSS